MNKITRCSLIIKDDFNNVLIIQRKVKRGQPKLWSVLIRDIKGKETVEKCLEKIAKDDLKGIVFNLSHVKDLHAKDLHVNECDVNSVYTGIIKETIVLHKDITSSKWINDRVLNDYDFIEEDKQILTNYFKSLK